MLFKFNLEDATFSKEQQDCLLNLIYDHHIEEAGIKKLHSELDHLAYMSSLICHLGCQCLGPVFVTPWRCLADQHFSYN